MRAVTLHAFVVTVYGNNDNTEKRLDKKNHTDTERIDFFSLFYCVVVKNFEFRSM